MDDSELETEQAPDERRRTRGNILKLSMALAASFGLVLGDRQVAAIAKVLSDPMAMLGERSPGARDDDGLAPIKAARPMVRAVSDDFVAPNVVVPTAMLVLPEAHDPRQPPHDGDSIAGPAGAPVGVPGVGIEGGTATPTGLRVPVGEAPPPGGTPSPPGFATPLGGPGDPPRRSVPADYQQSVTAVPEPSSWFLAIWGFMSVGGWLRHNRRSRRALAH